MLDMLMHMLTLISTIFSHGFMSYNKLKSIINLNSFGAESSGMNTNLEEEKWVR
jgi:hypothetical protein